MSTQLVIGASGLVGEHLVLAARNAGYDAVGTYRSHQVEGMRPLDICAPGQVKALLEELRPAVVCVAASLANVDYCEQHADEAYCTNVEGLCNVVKATAHLGAKLVYFSSDYVFDGKAGPYREDDPANPVCEYGRQKLAAEHYIALHAHDYLIVRTTVVYGWERQGKNFIYRLVDTLRAGRPLSVPVDQIGNPTYAPNLAQAVVRLVKLRARGIYHVVGPDRVDRFTFATQAAETFGLDDGLLRPVATAALGQAAPRPLCAGMQIAKAVAMLDGPLIGYREGLEKMALEDRRLDRGR